MYISCLGQRVLPFP